MDEAINLCRSAARLEPDQPRYAYSLGFFLRQSGRFMEATTALEGVMTRHPRQTEAALLLGEIYEEQGLRERAEEVYRKALRGAPSQQTHQQILARLEGLSN